MIPIKNCFSQFVYRTVTVLLTVLFCASSLIGGINCKEPPTPKDFQPTLRFLVCSDIHLDGDPNQPAALRTAQMFRDAYAYAAADKSYQRLDAVLVAGDFATSGDEKEYQLFNKIVKKNKKDETKLLTVLGNHEFIKYRDEDASVGYDVYRKYMGEMIDTHNVICGYHFIGVSYDPNGKTFKGKRAWLKKELDKAVKDDPQRPIIVFQHPHPTATVYGSINWSDLDIRLVLDRYPQVVDFSGHSHYAASDPRAIWQGAFTAIGTGSLSAFMGNLNYMEGDKDAPGESGGFWMVEADESGRIRLRLYDIVNHCFLENIDYFLNDLNNITKRRYSWGNQLLRDTAPKFPENAEIKAEYNANGELLLKFPDATGYYEAESYKIVITNAKNKIVFEKTVFSDYVRAGQTGVCVSAGSQKPGRYHVRITSYSPYAKTGGTLKTNVIAG